jgi:hypothetical protein
VSSAATIASNLRARFATEVATPQSLVTVYDNTERPPITGRWCRFVVLLGEQALVSVAGVGQRRYRTTGAALAQLFEPLDTGDGSQWALVAAIQDAFRSVSLSGPPFITFDAPSISGNPVREESWWMRVVSIPFRADEYA